MLQKPTISLVLALIGVNLLYSTVSICSKLASQCELMSIKYLMCIAGSVAILGVYAILWQQILKRTTLSFAYMFKGTSLIFVLILASLIFGEQITLSNIIGAAFIITGITLYSKS
ncbi:MAG: EamA family transporter [Paludibacteraceae bacterium]|nr:EamA family transporter [Paludibacteraceae bacterium]